MTWYTTADARADAERIGRRERRRLAPTPEQSYRLRRIGDGAVCQGAIPPSVFAFLVTQQLVSTRPTMGGETLVELSAAGALEALVR